MKTPPEPSIPYLIHRIAVRIEDSVNARARKYGLKVNEIRVLMRLVEHGDMRVGELAELTSLEPSTLSHTLRRIGAAGWIARNRAATDNRQVLVSLTPKGKRFARLLHPHIRRYNDVASEHISVAELRTLRGALDRIYQNLLGMDKSLPDFPDFDGRSVAPAPKRRRMPRAAAKP